MRTDRRCAESRLAAQLRREFPRSGAGRAVSAPGSVASGQVPFGCGKARTVRFDIRADPLHALRTGPMLALSFSYDFKCSGQEILPLSERNGPERTSAYLAECHVVS